MLPKHWARRVKTQESLQRTLCRAAVISCAVLPILCLMTATLYWKLPWVSRSYANQLSAMISDHCGVSATIGELKYLAPNRVEIKNLKVSHPETFEVMLEVPLLTAERHSSQWVVRMDSPQCAIDQVLKLSRMAHDRFLCRADDRLAPVHVIANIANITLEDHLLWKGCVETLFMPSAGKTELRTVFSLEEGKERSIDICFIRDRTGQEHQTTTQLETKGMSVPICLLKDIAPLTRYLGNEATFEGAAVWVNGQEDKMMIGHADVKNIELSYLTNPLPYQMTGNGSVYLNHVTIIGGRVQDALGVFAASMGSIPNEWLQRARSMLGVQLPTGLTLGQGPSHEYRKIEVQFEIASDGIRIVGGESIKPAYVNWPLVVLSDANGPLLYEPARDTNNNPATLPISKLVSWFCSTAADDLNSNPVKPATYLTPNVAQSNTLGAYLMTVLPSASIRK